MKTHAYLSLLFLMAMQTWAIAQDDHDHDHGGGEVIAFSRVDAGETLDHDWVVYDVGTGVKPSFDFDSQGRLHVMGLTEAEPGVVWYAVANEVSDTWEPQVVREGYFYGPGDLRVDNNDTAHFAWHDHDDEDPNHFAVDASGNGQFYPIPTAGHNGWDNALAISAAGNLYQSSINPREFGTQTSLEFGSFNGTTWDYQAVEGSGDFTYGLNTTLAIDSNENAHILFCDCDGFSSAGELRYAQQTDSGFDVTTVTSGGVVGRFPVAQLDDNDVLHAAWVDADSASSGSVQYGRLVDGSWEIETVAELDNIRLGFTGARKLVSLEIDSEGSPHLAFGDQNSIYYAERVDDSWEQTPVLASENSLYNGHVVLRLDEVDDAPTLVFWQPDQPGSGTVRIASPDFTDIQPGDANRDGEFNQLDLFQVLRNGSFRNGEAATWEDGDWDGAPNGRLARPPEGNGVFDNQDLITALAADQWLAGSYLTDDSSSVAGEPPVDYEDGEVHASKLLTSVSLLYDPSSGSLVLDTENTLLSSISIDSESGLFDGELAIQLGEFDNYTTGNLFKATFSDGFGDLDFGKALLPGLSEEQLLGDLQITGSYASGGFLENVNVQVVPEPSSSVLLAMAMSFLGLLRIRRSR